MSDKNFKVKNGLDIADTTSIILSNPSSKGLIVKAAASQTTNLQEWQDSAGTVLAKIDASGNISIGSGISTSGSVLSATGIYSSYASSVGLPRATGNANLAVSTGSTTNIGILVRGVASQTANLQEWQNSAGTVLAKIDSSGNATFNTVYVGLGGGAISTNIALGGNALLSNTTGFSNSAIGFGALQTNTTGWGNTAIGNYALQNYVGSVNTAIGAYSLRNATAEGLVAIGYGALSSNTSGGSNTAVGYNALTSVVTGGANTAFGSQNSRLTTGDRNTSVGFWGLFNLTTGSDNTAIGQLAGQSFTTGSQNVIVGSYAAWYGTSTGSNNVIVGFDAGGSNITGSNNITIGYNTQPSSSSISNEVTIGNSSINTFRIPGINFKLTGTSSGPTTVTNDIVFSGNLTVNGTTTNLNSTNLVIEDKNIIIADVATPTDTTADGAGITIKGTTDKTLNWVQSTGSFTSSEPFIINSNSSSSKPLIIKGAVGQTADLQQWQDSNANVLVKINSSGEQVWYNASGTAIGSTSQYGEFYFNNIVYIAGAGNWGAKLNVATNGAANIGQIIRGSSSQTANLQQWQNSAGTVLNYITSGGSFGVPTNAAIILGNSLSTGTDGSLRLLSGGGINYIQSGLNITGGSSAPLVIGNIYSFSEWIRIDNTGTVNIAGFSASNKGLIIKAAASQTANLQEWQNSAGTVLAKVDANGKLDITPSSGDTINFRNSSGGLTLWGGNSSYFMNAGLYMTGGSWAAGRLGVDTQGAANIGLVVRGAASQTANLQEWQDSSGNILTGISSNGSLYSGKSYSSYNIESAGTIASSQSIANTFNLQGKNNLTYPSTVTGSGGNGWTSVTPNYGISPDETQTSTRYVWNLQGNCYVDSISNSNTYVGEVYTVSAYIKINSGTGSCALRYSRSDSSKVAGIQINLSTKTATSVFDASDYNVLSYSLIPVGKNWYRAIATIKVLVNHTNERVMFTATGNVGDVEVWGFQLEKGLSASPLTPTTNAYVTTVNTLNIPYGQINLQSDASTTGIIIKGAPSQTANLQQWQDSSGTVLTSISSNGTLTVNPSTGNTGFVVGASGGQTGDYQVIKFSQVGADKLNLISTVVSGGNSSFEIRQLIGSTTTTLKIDETSLVGIGKGNTAPTAQLDVRAYSASIIGQIIRGAASQTANLQEWQNSSGTVLAKINSTGALTTTGDMAVTNGAIALTVNQVVYSPGYSSMQFGSTVKITNYTTSSPTLIVQGPASQTANLQEWQDSSGNILAAVAANGRINAAQLGSTASGKAIITINGDSGGMVLSTAAVGNKGLILRGISNQTGNLFELQDVNGTVLGGNNALAQTYTGSTTPITSQVGGAVTGASGTGTTATVTLTSAPNLAVGDLITVAGITPSGYNATNVIVTAVSNTSPFSVSYANTTTAAWTSGGTVSAPAQASITARSVGTTGLIIRSLSSQTANLQEWQNSSGYAIARITPYSEFVITGTSYFSSATGYNARVNIYTQGAGYSGIVIRGTASQTADLQQWQNSAGTVLTKVDASGNLTSTSQIKGISLHTSNNYGQIGEYNSGAYFSWKSATASVNSGYGSGYAQFFVVPGTTAGTLKFVVRGGASGGETTILDNIDQTNGTANSYLITAPSASTVGLIVKAAVSQTADLQQWQDSNGNTYAKINTYGQLAIGDSNPSIYSNARISLNTVSASSTGLVIRGVASQTANLQEWQDSSGNNLARLRQTGALNLNGDIAGVQLAATVFNNTTVGAVIRGAASQTADLQQWQNNSGTVLAKVDANGNFSAITKSFDIPHPTKENMRLRYASLEGPENGVYIRGTAESNIIELPEYWTGLVHEDSITVSLTAVGSAQNIYVEKIENNKVYIGGDLEKAFFTVYGERKDIDKLVVEY